MKYDKMTNALAFEMVAHAYEMIAKRGEVSGATAILAKAENCIGNPTKIVVVVGNVIQYAYTVGDAAQLAKLFDLFEFGKVAK